MLPVFRPSLSGFVVVLGGGWWRCGSHLVFGRTLMLSPHVADFVRLLGEAVLGRSPIGIWVHVASITKKPIAHAKVITGSTNRCSNATPQSAYESIQRSSRLTSVRPRRLQGSTWVGLVVCPSRPAFRGALAQFPSARPSLHSRISRVDDAEPSRQRLTVLMPLS